MPLFRDRVRVRVGVCSLLPLCFINSHLKINMPLTQSPYLYTPIRPYRRPSPDPTRYGFKRREGVPTAPQLVYEPLSVRWCMSSRHITKTMVDSAVGEQVGG